jgi:hypothetical protein
MRIIRGKPKARVSLEVRAFTWSLLRTYLGELGEGAEGPLADQLARVKQMSLQDEDLLELCRKASDLSDRVMEVIEQHPPPPFIVLQGGAEDE